MKSCKALGKTKARKKQRREGTQVRKTRRYKPLGLNEVTIHYDNSMKTKLIQKRRIRSRLHNA